MPATATVPNTPKRRINKDRLSIQQEKNEAGKLGPETEAVIPDDLVVMYAGKLCDLAMKGSVRAANIHAAYLRSYPNIDANVSQHLSELEKDFNETFDKTKKRTIAIASKHPLWDKLGDIRGFSAYQLALLMCHIKDISRFPTGSNLMVYAGLASIKDPETGRSYPVTKANIAIIKEIYFKQNKLETVLITKVKEGDSIWLEHEKLFMEVESIKMKGKKITLEFKPGEPDQPESISITESDTVLRLKEFHGFNTALSGRLIGESTITDCLLRAKGYFYTMYKTIRERLIDRCMNGDECVMATKTDEKESAGKMKAGRWYMKGKKNQSLEAFTDANAKRRVARTFLYIFWEEWRKIKGLDVRKGYAIEYLKHQHWISLPDILAVDARITDEF